MCTVFGLTAGALAAKPGGKRTCMRCNVDGRAPAAPVVKYNLAPISVTATKPNSADSLMSIALMLTTGLKFALSKVLKKVKNTF